MSIFNTISLLGNNKSNNQLLLKNQVMHNNNNNINYQFNETSKWIVPKIIGNGSGGKNIVAA